MPIAWLVRFDVCRAQILLYNEALNQFSWSVYGNRRLFDYWIRQSLISNDGNERIKAIVMTIMNYDYLRLQFFSRIQLCLTHQSSEYTKQQQLNCWIYETLISKAMRVVFRLFFSLHYGNIFARCMYWLFANFITVFIAFDIANTSEKRRRWYPSCDCYDTHTNMKQEIEGYRKKERNLISSERNSIHIHRKLMVLGYPRSSVADLGCARECMKTNRK